MVRSTNETPAVDGPVRAVHPVKRTKPSLHVDRQLPETVPCSTSKLCECHVGDHDTGILTPEHEERQLTDVLIAMPSLATCQAPSLFRAILLTLCYMSIMAPPTMPSPVGRQYGLLTSASFCDIELTWSHSCFGLQCKSVRGSVLRTVPQNHALSTAGCLASQIASPLPVGPRSLRCRSLRFDAHSP